MIDTEYCQFGNSIWRCHEFECIILYVICIIYHHLVPKPETSFDEFDMSTLPPCPTVPASFDWKYSFKKPPRSSNVSHHGMYLQPLPSCFDHSNDELINSRLALLENTLASSYGNKSTSKHICKENHGSTMIYEFARHSQDHVTWDCLIFKREAIHWRECMRQMFG